LKFILTFDGRTRPVGLVSSSKMQGSETVFFEYAPAWLADPYRFLLSPNTIWTT
jgi:hypothetical protein